MNRMVNKERHSYSLGFSMIEILVSMVILGLVLVGLSSVFVFSERYLHSSQREDQALEYATDTLDVLKNEVDADAFPFTFKTCPT